MEAAAGAASLGMLADDALIATLRYLEDAELSERDRAALERSLSVLETIRELGGRQVVVRAHVRDMAPVGVIDETFQAITDAREGEEEELAVTVGRLQDAIKSILAGTADKELAAKVREFFDRLGAITLARSEEVTRPAREQRDRWIREALGS
jgi:hypothetical protein